LADPGVKQIISQATSGNVAHDDVGSNAHPGLRG
jgi:hypothetical protein